MPWLRYNIERSTSSTKGVRLSQSNKNDQESNISTKPRDWLQERAMLSPTNEQIYKINDLILSKFEASS